MVFTYDYYSHTYIHKVGIIMYEIDRYVKPTEHIQHCNHCRKELHKGDDIVKIIYDSFYTFPKFNYYHTYCFVICLKGMLKDLIKMGKKVRDRYLMEQL